MIYNILLIILINLCILNILILDFINILTKLELKTKNLNNLNSTNKKYNLINNSNNISQNKYFSHHNNCILNCTFELYKITYYYNNLTPYKNIYKMMPIKNEKKIIMNVLFYIIIFLFLIINIIKPICIKIKEYLHFSIII